MASSKAAKIKQNRINLRNKFWPDVDEKSLWFRKGNSGFATIPRGLSLVSQFIDAMSPGKPLSGTYLALWCYNQDEMLVTIQKPRQMALESGFTGQRAEYTWRARMKKIEELGLIRSNSGFSGPYHYILVLNPYLAVKNLKSTSHDERLDALYNTLIDRLEEIGERTVI